MCCVSGWSSRCSAFDSDNSPAKVIFADIRMNWLLLRLMLCCDVSQRSQFAILFPQCGRSDKNQITYSISTNMDDKINRFPFAAHTPFMIQNFRPYARCSGSPCHPFLFISRPCCCFKRFLCQTRRRIACFLCGRDFNFIDLLQANVNPTGIWYSWCLVYCMDS